MKIGNSMSRTKKKKAIIEPLYKNDAPFVEIHDPMMDATYDVLNQPEFDEIFFPYPKLMSALSLEQSLLEMIQKNFSPNQPPDLKKIKLFNRYMNKVLRALIKAYPLGIDNILETLDSLQHRAEEEKDKTLMKNVQLIRESLQTKRSTKKLAASVFLRELVLKQMGIFSQFDDELVERLGYDFETIIMDNANSDEELLEEIIEKFSKRYFGFGYMLLGLDEEDLSEEDENSSEFSLEEIAQIVTDGMEDVANGILFLNLFTKREIEDGLQMADDFYKELSDSDRERLQMMEADFPKSYKFRERILEYLNKKIDKRRIEKMVQKIEKYKYKSKYTVWIDFFLLLQRIISDMDTYPFGMQILVDIYFAEVRQHVGKTVAFAPLIFWYY